MGRLDFFLVSESLINFCTNEKINPGYRSDHSIIELTLQFENDIIKCKTFWKFNNSLLYNKDFVIEINKCFLACKEEYAAFPYNRDKLEEIENKDFFAIINPQLFLEMLLLKARSVSISFATALKKKEYTNFKELEHRIGNLESEDAEKNFDTIQELKYELKELRENKLKGSLIRSKAKWIEHGEKPSKYFCNLENRNFVSKRMSCLIDKNGTELKEKDLICNEVYEFYKSLYASREQNLEDINLLDRFKDDSKKLTDIQAASIEGPVTYEEISNTLKKMQNKKSPGSTGFTTEFF